MTTYDLGDGVNLRHKVYDRDGNLSDATVTLDVTLPDGSTDSVTVVRSSLGTYDANTYIPAAIGDYTYKWSVTGAVTDVFIGSFRVADPAPTLYCTLPQVKAQLSKDTTDERDDLIELAIRAASRKIDQLTGRRFYADTVASLRTFPLSSRLFTSPYGQAVRVDDIASLTDLVVAGGNAGGSYATWTSYFVGPDNAMVLGQPITYIQADAVSYSGINSVQITARWGWPSIPDEVESACVLLAARLYRRKDSPQGVISSADWGSVRVSRVDPDVEALLSHLILPGFA